MKRILILLTLLALLIPFWVSAQQQEIPNCCVIGSDVTFDGVNYGKGETVGSEDKCNLTGENTDHKTKKWGLICLLATIHVVTDWIFTFLMAFVGVMVVLGAITLVTAAGAPDKVNKGKNYILYAAIGMLVGLLAKAFPALVEALLSG